LTIVRETFDLVKSGGKVNLDIVNFGMLLSIPPEGAKAEVVKIELCTFDENNAEVKKDDVTKYMKGSNYFSVKAIFIPVYHADHYSLAVVINPNEKLVLLYIIISSSLYNSVHIHILL
jgi:Ulp1 family protease